MANANMAPEPPAHLFRTIKRLSSHSQVSHAVHLCIPRTLPPSLDNTQTEFCDLPASTYKNHKSVPQQKDIKTQMAIVVTAANPKILRLQANAIEEYSRTCASSHILQSQFTTSAASTWMCLRPIFGITLEKFGAASALTGGMPSYLIAQIFLSLLDVLEDLHDAGYTHNAVSPSNIMLDVWGNGYEYKYRGYPSVQLVDWAHARPVLSCSEKEVDARALLQVMADLILKCSDVAPFIKSKIMVMDEPMVALMHDVQEVLDDDGMFSLADVRQQFEVKLEKMRNAGPADLPRSLSKLLHSNLATDVEMKEALREPLTLKKKSARAGQRKPTQDNKVKKRSGGLARMKTKRVLEVKFAALKEDFVRIVGGG